MYHYDRDLVDNYLWDSINDDMKLLTISDLSDLYLDIMGPDEYHEMLMAGDEPILTTDLWIEVIEANCDLLDLVERFDYVDYWNDLIPPCYCDDPCVC